MSNIRLQGNPSGTGTLTIASPNTNSDFTLNLPSTLGNAGNSAMLTTDASGNAGLGVTPSAWLSSRKVFQFGATGSIANNSGNTLLGDNYYTDSTPTNRYLVTGSAATLYQQTSGAHAWYIAPSGTAGNAISFTQAMTLGSNGNFMVGTADASMFDTNAGADVGAFYRLIATGGGGSAAYGFTASNGGSDAGIGLWGLNSASRRIRIAAIGSQYTTSTAGSEASSMWFSTIRAGTLTEAARIDSSGNFGLGVTPSAWSGFKALQINNGSFASAGGNTLFGHNWYWNGTNDKYIANDWATRIRQENGTIGFASAGVGSPNANISWTQTLTVNTNGTYFSALNTTAAGANVHIWTGSSPANLLLLSTSSLRYKTAIEDLWESTADSVLKFRPIWYRSLGEMDRKDWSWYGFIAEEVAEIDPRLVNYGYTQDSYELDEEGNKKLKEGAEQVPDGVQYDRMVVLLTAMAQKQHKAIQEQQAIIEQLTTRIAALEAK